MDCRQHKEVLTHPPDPQIHSFVYVENTAYRRLSLCMLNCLKLTFVRGSIALLTVSSASLIN
jgi:hypothetical protein